MLRADMDALPVTGGHRPGLRQHGDRHRRRRHAGARHARLRARHARHLAGRRHRAARRARDAWQGTRARGLPARRGDRAGRAGDDRRRPLRPLPQAARSSSASTSCPGPPARSATAPGTTQAAADSLEVRLFGRGAHGSMPESSVDPVVMAAATVLRLQTIVSREVAASAGRRRHRRRAAGGHEGQRDPRRGAAEAQRPHASTRTCARSVLDAIERIVNAEAAASGAPQPPQITTTEHYPLTANDPDATARVAAALRDHFGDERVHELATPVSRPARTSARSAPSGACRRCSGTSAAPTPTLREGRAGRPRRGGHPDQPQPRVRARHPPDARDRRRGDDRGRA